MSFATFLPLLINAHTAPIHQPPVQHYTPALSDLGQNFANDTGVTELKQIEPESCSLNLSERTDVMRCQEAYLETFSSGATAITFEGTLGIFSFIGKRTDNSVQVMKVIVANKEEGTTHSADVDGACEIIDNSFTCAATLTADDEISGTASGKLSTVK